MSEIKRLKRVVIKEELYELTGDVNKAIILNQMLYWSERVWDFDKFITEEKRRAANEGMEIEMDLQNGWIYKSSKELAEEIMIASDKTVNRHLNELVEKGYLEQRTNPKYRWDKTYQYRVNLIKLAKDLARLNYTLEGYKFPLEEMFREIINTEKLPDRKDNLSYRNGKSSVSIRQFKKSEIADDEASARNRKSSVSKGQNETSEAQNEESISRNVRAIPEITCRDYYREDNQSISQSVTHESVYTKMAQSKVDAGRLDRPTDRPSVLSAVHELATTVEGRNDESGDLQANDVQKQNGFETTIKPIKDPDQQGFSSVLENAGLYLFPEDTRKLLQGVLEDMYYGQKFAEKIGLPRTVIQNRLQRVTLETLTYAVGRMKYAVAQGVEITNSRAYLSTVIFNAITEMDGDLIAKYPAGKGGGQGDSTPGNRQKNHLKNLYCS